MFSLAHSAFTFKVINSLQARLLFRIAFRLLYYSLMPSDLSIIRQAHL